MSASKIIVEVKAEMIALRQAENITPDQKRITRRALNLLVKQHDIIESQYKPLLAAIKNAKEHSV